MGAEQAGRWEAAHSLEGAQLLCFLDGALGTCERKVVAMRMSAP